MVVLAGVIQSERVNTLLEKPGENVLKVSTGCPIKNASTLKGQHILRFEYFFKRFEGGKSLNISLS